MDPQGRGARLDKVLDEQVHRLGLCTCERSAAGDLLKQIADEYSVLFVQVNER